MTTAMPRPVSIVFGKIRSGSLVSSTMLTESSNPTIEKNAIAVATVTAANMPRSLEFSNADDLAQVGSPLSPSRRSR